MPQISPEIIRDNYQFTLRHLKNNIFRLGRREGDGAIVYLLNEGPIPRQYGATTETVFNKTPLELFGPELAGQVEPYFERAFAGEVCSYELTFDRVVFETVLSPVELEGRIVEVAGSSHDITERRRHRTELEELNSRLAQANEELRQAVETDSLTGLNNRRKFDAMMEYELTRASRYRSPFCVIIGDADHFKDLNDRYGHLTGDAILCTLGDIFRVSMRDCDTVARWGGEEFAFLLPETDREGALIAGNKLLQRIHDFDFGQTPGVTMSFGISVWRDGDDLESLVRRADRALYRAKQAGRDRLEMEEE